MGGADAVIARARADFQAGHYRWVAEVMNHVVFAEPDNRAARELLADAYEQLGYAAEAATWRNAYLFGAYELRNGVARQRSATPIAPDALRSLTIPMLFDFFAVRLNGPKADGNRIVINWGFADTGETYTLTLENATLTYISGKQAADADATLTLTRATLDTIMLRQTTFIAAMQSGAIKVEGNPAKLSELWSLFDEFQPMFDIVTP